MKENLLKLSIDGERKSPPNILLVKPDLLKPTIVGEKESLWNVLYVNKIYLSFPAAVKNTAKD